MGALFDEDVFNSFLFDESGEEVEVIYYWLKGGERHYFRLVANEMLVHSLTCGEKPYFILEASKE